MDPVADHAASALGGSLSLLASSTERGWGRVSPRSATFVTGAPVPFLNGVRVVRPDCEPSEARDGLADIAREGVPFSLEVRPEWRGQGEEIAASLGMTLEGETPLMAANRPVKSSAVDGLSLRTLEPAESSLHAQVAAPAFGMSTETWDALISAGTLVHSGIHVYLGEADGEPVTTAMTVRIGGAVGVYSVATADAHRGRGYGAAITAVATNEAFLQGASLVWLQSSDMGYGVYERLGFRTVERWPGWVSAAG